MHLVFHFMTHKDKINSFRTACHCIYYFTAQLDKGTHAQAPHIVSQVEVKTESNKNRKKL